MATTNSAGSLICLPQFCTETGNDVCTSFDISNKFESTLGSWKKEKIAEITYLKSGVPQRLDCSLCFDELASTIVTFPGSNKCPQEWALEYQGVLSQVWELTGDFICVDPSSFNQTPESDNFHRLAAVDIDCFGPDCKQSKGDNGIPCVVCSFTNTINPEECSCK